MPELPWPDVVAGIIVAVVFLTGMGIAYRRGFRAALPVGHERFDDLTTSLSLDNTNWELDIKLSDATSDLDRLRITMRLEQAGSRLIGTGRDTSDREWQLEGICSQRHVLCFLRGSRKQPAGPGIFMLRSNDAGRTLAGYHIAWNADGKSLGLEEITFRRAPHNRRLPAEIPENKLTSAT